MGEGSLLPPPANFEALQLQQEGLVWSNLQMNWVTWVPIMNKTQKMLQNFNKI